MFRLRLFRRRPLLDRRGAFVDIAAFWWLLPFAVLGVPAGLAVFTGAALLAANEARRAFHLRGTGRVLAFAIAWGIGEWLRGHILTGFPVEPDRLCLVGSFPRL